MMKPKMTLVCFPEQPGSRELGRPLPLLSPHECDMQGTEWMGVALMRKKISPTPWTVWEESWTWETICAEEAAVPNTDK